MAGNVRKKSPGLSPASEDHIVAVGPVQEVSELQAGWSAPDDEVVHGLGHVRLLAFRAVSNDPES